MILILLSLVPLRLAAQNASNITGDRFEETSGRGLVIRTNPIGVKVFIDGAERALTPAAFENLPPGEYNIRLSKEGYKERNFQVTLFSTSRLVVSIKMEEERGLIQVSVQTAAGYQAAENLNNFPFVPEIITSALDDIISTEVLSDAHNALISMPFGYRTIRVRAFGWEDASETVFVSGSDTVKVNIIMQPAIFKITNFSQNRKQFNPLNKGSHGSAEFHFDVSAPGSCKVTIKDADDSVVYTKYLEDFNTWHQTFSWDGKDASGNALPQGSYTVLIETQTLTQSLTTEIKYADIINPLSSENGISGLTFSPLPHVLPAGSYQIAAGIYFGSFPLRESSASEMTDAFGLPVEINMRIAPFNRFELTTSVNLVPYFEDQIQKSFAGWGVTGSAKFNIKESSSIPLSFAAGVSYTWAGNSGELPLSPGKGIGIYAPLSLELTNLSLVFCPASFWPGPEGLIPTLLLSAGALYRGTNLNAGLSARCEMDFTKKTFNPKYLAGADVYLYPLPSNLFISFSAGVIYQERCFGWYGGFKIGIIN